jgi:hypothetical protein
VSDLEGECAFVIQAGEFKEKNGLARKAATFTEPPDRGPDVDPPSTCLHLLPVKRFVSRGRVITCQHLPAVDTPVVKR